MGHLGGYRGYSADVQTDDLEEYWSADLEARLGKTLPRKHLKHNFMALLHSQRHLEMIFCSSFS